MVQAKQKKSKQKGKPHAKKQGKKADLTEFNSHLDALGLKIVEVTADGNCFFRALADQLEGNEEQHQKYRLMVVQYIVKHREEYEPFIEDEVPFDEYCQSMEEDGTWAGNMELQAGSLVTHSNICIHRGTILSGAALLNSHSGVVSCLSTWQEKLGSRGPHVSPQCKLQLTLHNLMQMMSPRWYIRNFDGYAARMIHLSYHNEEHYNSVRSKEDPCSGPAKPIVIKADADLSATSSKAKVSATKSKGRSSKIADSGSVKQVMLGSGCEDSNKVEQILQLVDYDVDTAIEFLIAEQEVEYDLIGNGEHPCKDVTPGHDEDRDCKLPEIPEVGTASDMKPSIDNKRSQSSDKSYFVQSIPRNKVCPCGSKKKYKSCCGSVKGKSASEFLISHKVAPVMGRKERKQGKKGEASKNVSSGRLDGDPTPPDMGALCI